MDGWTQSKAATKEVHLYEHKHLKRLENGECGHNVCSLENCHQHQQMSLLYSVIVCFCFFMNFCMLRREKEISLLLINIKQTLQIALKCVLSLPPASFSN